MKAVNQQHGRSQRGFTLIELMIVVAIIGILAAVSVSEYTKFTIRAKLTEILQIARRDRDMLREYFHLNGALPADPADAGVDVSADKNQYLTADVSISWSGSSALVIYAVDIGGDAAGELRFTGEQNGSDLDFTCSSPDFPPRYLPQSCK